MADASFDGWDLDCGNGLLLLIREQNGPVCVRGCLLQFRTTDLSVEADFPAWCRMTGKPAVAHTPVRERAGSATCRR